MFIQVKYLDGVEWLKVILILNNGLIEFVKLYREKVNYVFLYNI